MSHITDARRDTVAIAQATSEILETIRVEREAFLGDLDSLTAATLSAVEADAANDTIARDAHCKALLDLSYDVLGDCDPVEHLTALLGYVEPDPE